MRGALPGGELVRTSAGTSRGWGEAGCGGWGGGGASGNSGRGPGRVHRS